jgi:hypothetical protein
MPTIVEVPNLGKIEFPDEMSHDDIASSIKNLLSKKGGEQTNENAKSKSDQGARSQGDAQRTLDGKVNSALPDGTQASDQPSPQDQGQPQRGDNANQGLIADQASKGGEKDAKQKDAKAEDGYGSQVRKEDGQGIRSQEDAGKQAQVSDKTGSVRPAPDNFFQRAYSKALANPKEAAEVAIGSVAKGAIENLAGGKLSELAFKYTPGPLPVKVAAGVAGFVGGQQITDALLKTADKYLSSSELQRAQADQPELAEIGQIISVAPQGLESLKNLGKAFSSTMTKEGAVKASKELAGKLAIGAGAGAAVGEITSGFKQTKKEATENAFLGAILSGYHEGAIANEGLPETAKVAAETKPDDIIEKEQAPKFEEAPAKPITLEPVEQTIPKDQISETRGKGVQYHGSKSELPDLKEGYYNPDNIYGGQDTFYTTDALDIAKGYGRKKPTAAVYETKEKQPVNFYNMEDPMPSKHWEGFFDTQSQPSDYADLIETSIDDASKANNGTPNLRQVMDEIRSNARGMDLTKDDVQEIFTRVSDNLIKQGYGGMTHVGGLKTNTEPHNVKIYFDAPNQLEFSKIEKPAEAQPTQPSEAKEQVKETSGLPTLQGKPPVGEAEVKAEGGTPQGKREGEEGQVAPEGTRIASAAYLAPDGKVYEGADHIAAMEKARDAGAITQEEIDAKQDEASRNTDEFGFKVRMPDGTTQVTTREAAGKIAKQSGQALVENFVHGDKLHSTETRMDEYNHLGEPRVSPQKFAEDPKAAVQEAIPEPTEENLQKQELTRPDAEALGIYPKESKQNFVIDSVKNKVQEIGDAIKYRGKNIKELRKAGVEDEANQHAHARVYVPFHVEELLGQVFGDTTNIDKMRPTMDILVKDDIVGGYEDIVSKVNGLESEKTQAQTEGKPTKQIQNNIDSLSQRARDISETHPIDQYKQEIENASPEIQGNIERWKRHVVPEMDSLYNELKNVDPNTEREGRGWKFGARLNLLSKTEEEKMASYGDLDKPMPSTSVANYRNPNVKRDKFMQKASFLGNYSTDPVAILTNSLASRWNEVTKIRFYKALESKGAGRIVAPGEEAPETIGGKEAVRLPIKFPETDPKTGITRVVEQNLYVQKGLEDEVKKILDVDSRPQQHPLTKEFTKIQILGFADATAHLKNLQNVTRNALGRDSAWADITAKIPFLGQAQSVKEIASVAKEVASKSQKIRDEKAYLGKIGALRPFYPAEGIQRFLGTHQLLNDVDTATRIILNRRYDQLVKRYGAVDTESARRDFINQVGNYNRRLMSRWETLARDTGFSPFIVAGRAMNRYARKMVTGDPGFQTDNVRGAIAARATQISSLAFSTLIPAITNMFTTGNPFGRDGTPIGAIDFGPNYDTEDGKRRTFDVFALTGLRRGLRQFGIDSAIDGARSGKDPRDIARDISNGIVTTKAHPWIGPAVGLAQETLTGKRFDLRTGYAQRYDARKIEGFGQYLENFRIALKQLNPLLYGIAGRGVEYGMKELAGIPEPSEERESKENIGLISKATGAPKLFGEVEGAIEKPVLGAVGYKESPSEAIKLANSFGEAVQFTPEQDQRFTYRRKIKEALSKGDRNSAIDLYQQGFNDGILTEADKKSIGRYIKYPDKAVQKFQMLKTADEAVRVWRVATAKEQDAVADIVAKKIQGSTTLKPDQRQKLKNTFFSMAKPGTEVYEIAKQLKKQ